MQKYLLLPLALLISCGDGSTGPEPDPVSVATTSLPDGTVGASYSVTLAASGGTGSYAWAVSAGSLPAGLSLSASGGIAGAPSAAGTSSFTVRATSGKLSGTRDLSITVQPPEVVITTGTLADGTAGAAYSQALAASGGTGTFTWSLAGGALPAGLTLSAAGVIAGTPSAGGTSAFTVQVSSGGRTATRPLTITVAFPVVSVSTATLPDGTVGTGYNQTLAATGGTGSYAWSLTSGTLPLGLTLYASGQITGTPTSTGTSSFTVQVVSGTASAAKALSITVQSPPLTITPTSLPEGAVGVAYSQALAAAGALGAVTWTLASGALPPGTTLSAAGVIAGSPTVAGSYTFSVRATSGAQSAVQSLTLVVQPPPVVITTTTLKAAVQNVAYADTLRATGGTGSYTWSRTAGSLPAGLTLSAGGVISGTPTTAGNSSFTVQATSGTRTATKDFTIAVQGPVLSITTTSLVAGAVGDPYSDVLTATGGTGTYGWAITSGSLPPGLTLNGSSGAISGTPSTAGTYPFTVQATSGSQNASKSLSITVSSALPPLTILTSALPGGNVGEDYAVGLSASGGTGGYTWSLSAGSLPPGLALAAGGAINGQATTEGDYPFTVQVVSGSRTATKALSINIGPALPPVTITTTSPLPGGTVGAAYSQQLAASGGNGSFTWSVVSGLTGSGLSLSAAGQVTGSPVSAGDVTFTVRATSGSKTATQQFTITVVPGPVNITTTSLANGTVGVAYSRTLQATGGSGGGFTWSVSGGSLPAWLTLDPSTGALTGTPPAEGTFNFTVRATSGALFDDQPLTLTVAYPAVVITTASPMPAGTVGAAYSQQLAASGGSGVYTWSTAGGSLPNGLTLSAGGAITGTPTAAGTFNFTVQAQSGSQSATKPLQIVIAPTGGYAMYLNVGDNPSESVSRGAGISIPLVVDLSQQGTQNLASITVRVDWDNTRFDYVSAPAGNWVDIDGSPASVTINTSTATSGYITITAYLGGDPDPALTGFALRTINLTAKASAPTGATSVAASVDAAGNKDGQAVTVTVRNLNVTIN